MFTKEIWLRLAKILEKKLIKPNFCYRLDAAECKSWREDKIGSKEESKSYKVTYFVCQIYQVTMY